MEADTMGFLKKKTLSLTDLVRATAPAGVPITSPPVEVLPPIAHERTARRLLASKERRREPGTKLWQGMTVLKAGGLKVKQMCWYHGRQLIRVARGFAVNPADLTNSVYVMDDEAVVFKLRETDVVRVRKEDLRKAA
jgi:hypothetical protein